MFILFNLRFFTFKTILQFYLFYFQKERGIQGDYSDIVIFLNKFLNSLAHSAIEKIIK